MKEGGFFKKNIEKAKRIVKVAIPIVGMATLPNTVDAQNVKEKEPIYVTNKNDPRLKAYDDSLDLYGEYENMYSPVSEAAWDKYIKSKAEKKPYINYNPTSNNIEWLKQHKSINGDSIPYTPFNPNKEEYALNKEDIEWAKSPEGKIFFGNRIPTSYIRTGMERYFKFDSKVEEDIPFDLEEFKKKEGGEAAGAAAIRSFGKTLPVSYTKEKTESGYSFSFKYPELKVEERNKEYNASDIKSVDNFLNHALPISIPFLNGSKPYDKNGILYDNKLKTYYAVTFSDGKKYMLTEEEFKALKNKIN